jgi:hypothetical protein
MFEMPPEDVPVPVGPRASRSSCRGWCVAPTGDAHRRFPGPRYPFYMVTNFRELEEGPVCVGWRPARVAQSSPVLLRYRCRNGQQHYCERLGELWHPNGGFSEHIIVDSQQVFAIPDGVSLDAAAFVEPLSVCVHCIDMADIKPGMSVAITGAGPIGLILLQLAIRSGAAFTLVSEPVASRGMAKNWRALSLTARGGYRLEVWKTAADLVIEASGNAHAADACNITGKKSSFLFRRLSADLKSPSARLCFKGDDRQRVFSHITFPRSINAGQVDLESLTRIGCRSRGQLSSLC